MTKSTPTPTPWRIAGGSRLDGRNTTWIHTGEKTTKASAAAMTYRESDAAFIVRAVNSHDALIAALERSIWYMESSLMKGIAAPAVSEARAALASAREA
jgi:hypothetical protein